MPTPLVKARRFDHLTIIAADLDATRNFYVNLLGLEEVPRPNFSFPGIWLQLGDVSIHVTQSDPNSGLAGWGDRQVKVTSRGHHFAFEVDDCLAATESLKAAGVKLASGPQTRPDGIKQVYFFDPDDHLVELYSE